MKIRIERVIICFLFTLFLIACKKDKEIVEFEEEEHKPVAAFSYELIDDKDPFTFKFKNLSEGFKESRWSFGDDSTSSFVSPEHTFLSTGRYLVKLVTLNGEGYWAQREAQIEIAAKDFALIKTKPTINGELRLWYESDLNIVEANWLYHEKKEDVNDSPPISFGKGQETSLFFENTDFKEISLNLVTEKGSKFRIPGLIAELGIVNDVTLRDHNFIISHENSGGREAKEGSLKMMDNNIATKFFVGGVDDKLNWIIEFYEPQIMNGYIFTSGNDSPERDPQDWTIEGSMDGENWVIIDKRDGEEFEKRIFSKTYQFDNQTAFMSYRFNITKLKSGSNFQMGELRLLEIPR